MPRIPGLLECIQQELYDMNQAITAATQSLSYFQVPIGGQFAATAAIKSAVETNMQQGGSLPYPKNYEIHAIRLVNQFGSAVSDLCSIFNSSWFKLFIGTKDYLVVNSFMLTGGVGLTGISAGNTNVVSVHNGRPDQRGVYVLAEPIDLIPQQNFRCELIFPISITLTLPVNLSVLFSGFLKREVH